MQQLEICVQHECCSSEASNKPSVGQSLRLPYQSGHRRAMATETSPRPRSATPSTIPQKRPMNLDDEQHIPAVSSPLNPDAPPSRARKAPAREQREKKESLKKREAKGVDTTRSSTPDAQPNTKRSKKVEKPPDVVRPVRYYTKPPSQSDFDAPRPPVFNPVLTKANRDFNECFEQCVCLLCHIG